MNTDQSVHRDERTVAVENASYKWPYIFLTFALLIDTMYRGLVRNEAAWDLLALVIVSSGICTVYQARQKMLGQGWVWKAAIVGCLAGVIAALVAILIMYATGRLV